MVLWRAPQSHRPRAGPRGPILTPRQEVDGFQSGLPHALFQHSLLTQGMGRFGTCDDSLSLLDSLTNTLRNFCSQAPSPQSTIASVNGRGDGPLSYHRPPKKRGKSSSAQARLKAAQPYLRLRCPPAASKPAHAQKPPLRGMRTMASPVC